ENAQREEYLSDIVNLLAQAREGGGYRVRALRVDDPHAVMGYNSPDELLAVEEYYRQRREAGWAPAPLLEGPGYRAVDDWLALFGALEPEGESALSANLHAEVGRLRRELQAVYGTDPAVLKERREAFLRVLACARAQLGERTPVLLVRAPGRANILGRHVDHQGGHCNLLAINREILMAVHPRSDDQVTLHNVADEPFGTRAFGIGELLSQLPWEDWLSLVDSRETRRLVAEAQGDWSQYARAAVLRLQKRYPSMRLRGMDLVVMGDIPIAAGLSSSSALVVATAEATLATNAIDLLPAQFVDLAGEGEWFVGTRGGSADHAAMILGEKGKVTQVTFFDFAVVRKVDFPADYRLVICNSGVQARKAAGARQTFNQRVACYRLGLALVRAAFPQYAPLLEHLRDINTRRLGVPLSWIYRIVLSLPERTTRGELAELLPSEVLDPILATHAAQDEGYPVREVVLYGLAECERSRIGAEILAQGQVVEFGRLMQASHNGDRVVSHDAEGRAVPYRYRVSNAALLDLMAALESGDPARVLPAQLHWQPGAYRCSTPEIDRMVDLAVEVPGVAGAQLAGAGLGGCMMALVRHDAVGELRARLADGYYRPQGLAPEIVVCTSIAGSSVLLDPRHRP
ncbi:MAG: galactokinase, partial [Chloroflexi bacterium]|nr:galactokinase [Chloroflexota bacterium]